MRYNADMRYIIGTALLLLLCGCGAQSTLTPSDSFPTPREISEWYAGLDGRIAYSHYADTKTRAWEGNPAWTIYGWTIDDLPYWDWEVFIPTGEDQTPQVSVWLGIADFSTGTWRWIDHNNATPHNTARALENSMNRDEDCLKDGRIYLVVLVDDGVAGPMGIAFYTRD